MSAPPSGAHLRVFGSVDLKDPSGREVRAVLAQPKRLALLVYLALAGPDRFVRRDTLIALFWPDSDQDAARHSLRSALHFLRQSLGEGVVVSRGQEEVGLSETGLWCDAIGLAQALEAGKPADALRLYRGDLLEGFFIPDASAELEQWLDRERSRFRTRAAEAAATLAESAEREANAGLARHWATRCLELAPHDEDAARRLMGSLVRLGDRAGALGLYEGLVGRLAKDLEIEPSVETRNLARAIRGSAPAMGSPPADRPDVPKLIAAPRASPRHRLRRPITLVASLLALLGIGIVALRFRSAQPAAVPMLAVGTIESRLGPGPDSAGLSGAIRDLLATDLARIEGIQVVSEARLIELLSQLGIRQETPAARSDAARRAGARELLEGVLYRRGPDRLRLDLRRVDLASGVLQGSLSAEAGDVFALADSASAALGRSYGLRVPVDPLASVTTTSLVARRFYEEGLRAYYQGDRTSALRLFHSALAEDSSFAMAAYYAAQAATEAPAIVGFILQARRAAATEKERLTIAAGWAKIANDRSLLALAESLATRYPSEPNGEYAWGLALQWSGDLAAALVHLRRALTMDSLGFRGGAPECRACDALNLIVEIHTSLGDWHAAETTLRDWVARQPQSAAAWAALLTFLERAGRAAEVAAAHERLVQLAPDAAADWAWLRARLAIRAGDFTEADQWLARQLSTPGIRDADVWWWRQISLRNQERLEQALHMARRYREAIEADDGTAARLPEAQVLFESGRFREAARLFEELANVALQPTPADSALGSFGSQARRGSWALTHAAGAWAAAGDTARLALLADSVERLGARSAFGRDQRLHFHLRGLLAKARGRPQEAEAMFRRAQLAPVGGFSRINLELGRLLLERGRPQEAIEPLRGGLQYDIEASNYYVTHRELHRELARAFRASGMSDSAAVHERWGRIPREG